MWCRNRRGRPSRPLRRRPLEHLVDPLTGDRTAVPRVLEPQPGSGRHDVGIGLRKITGSRCPYTIMVACPSASKIARGSGGEQLRRCAFPDCRQELIAEMTAAEGVFLVGQEAHIVGQSADGPRGESDLIERDTYENLVLLALGTTLQLIMMCRRTQWRNC